MKTITLEGDLKVTTHATSPNFDPLAANVAQLVANGFPAIPDEPHHRERFARAWSKMKDKFHYIEPTFRVEHDRTHGPRKPGIAESTQTSGNWSGAVVNPPAGQTFKWIEGDWVVPAISAPTQNHWYYAASWIGIDGDGSASVFQAGVESQVYASANSTTINYYPWWEWYPGPSIAITNFPVTPGDMIIMLLCSAGVGSTTGTVYWTNATTGATTNVTLTAPAGTKLVGNCAEWIVEAPTVNGGQSAIADYGEVFFSVCEAVTSTGTTVNGGTGNNINMTAAGKVVSDGNLITPTVVQCLYAGTRP